MTQTLDTDVAKALKMKQQLKEWRTEQTSITNAIAKVQSQLDEVENKLYQTVGPNTRRRIFSAGGYVVVVEFHDQNKTPSLVWFGPDGEEIK